MENKTDTNPENLETLERERERERERESSSLSHKSSGKIKKENKLLKNKTIKKCMLICMFIILLLIIQQKIYSRFVFQQEVQVEVNYRAVKIKEEEIIISPQEWTDKVKVTIISSETLCDIQYKIGNQEEWQNYTEEGFEVTENTTIHARLVYKNPGYADQIMPETSKKVTNIDDIPPEVSLSQTRLADVVSIGDYVAYDATSGGEYTYTTDSTLTGSEKQTTFSSSDEMKWRVLSVDKDSGTVKLMSAEPTTNILALFGKLGYKNAEIVLNDISAIYGHGKGAISGRSIKMMDVEQYSTYDKTSYISADNIKYGQTIKYTKGTFINDDKLEVIASENNEVTMEQTNYQDRKIINYMDSSIYNMIFKKSTNMNEYKQGYFTADCSVGLAFDFCSMNVKFLGKGDIKRGELFESGGSNFSSAYAVVPVITLQTNIQTTGKDQSGAWTIQGERTIKGTAKDEQTGVVAYQYSKDGTLTNTSEGWTTVEKTANLEAPEYEIGDYGTYYFYAKDEVGNMSKTEIKAGKLVASSKIGENTTYHTSLQDAINKAGTSKATVMLLESVKEGITIAKGQNINLNLNGNILTNTSGNIITNNGTLTIKDSLKTGKIYSNTSEENHIKNEGVLQVESGKIEICEKNSEAIENRGTTRITGGVIKASDEHSAISNLSQLYITAGRLDGGIGINNIGGTLEIQGGIIKGRIYEGIRTNKGTITIGNKDGKVNTSVPIIQGKQYGINIAEGAVVNFYDGIAKGVTSAINGTVTDIEDKCEIANGTETINGETYKTRYLKLKQYKVIYDYNYDSDDIYGESTINLSNYKSWTLDNTVSYNQKKLVDNSEAKLDKELQFTMNATYGGIYLHLTSNEKLVEGKTYTYSVYIKSDSNHKICIGSEQGGQIKKNITAKWQKITWTFTAKETYYKGFTFYVREQDSTTPWNQDEKLYIHSLKMMEGELTSEATKYYGTKLGNLPTPSRAGYKFIGWYTDPENGEQITGEEQVTEEKRYYAHWEKEEYKIEYDLSEGKIETENPITYNVESSDITLNNPTKETYTFTGWTEQIKDLKWTKGFINIQTGKVQYSNDYPNSYYTDLIYLEKGKTYVLGGYGGYSGFKYRIYDMNMQYQGTTDETNTYTPDENCYIRILYYKYSKEEQRANSVITSQTTDITEVIPKGSTGNRKYIANFELNKYTVKYNYNLPNYITPSSDVITKSNFDGGANNWVSIGVLNLRNLEYGDHVYITLDLEYNNLEVNEDKNYGIRWQANGDFSVWGAGSLYGDGKQLKGSGTLEYSNFISLADIKCFDNVQYYFSLRTDYYTSGTMKITNVRVIQKKSEEKQVNHGSTLETLPVLEEPGYTFLGWYTDPEGGTQITNEDIITQDMEYYAHWKENDKVIVRFNNTLDGSTTIKSALQGQKILLTNPTKEGYEFKGWYTDETYTTKVGNAKEKYTVLKDQTLYAYWEYAIEYDLAGGTLETENPTSYSEKTEDITLNNPTRLGYTFVGWTGTNLTEPTKTVTISKGSTGSRSYTANWEANEVTVTYNYNGATGDNTEIEKNVKFDNEYGTLPTPTKEGYSFDSWGIAEDISSYENKWLIRQYEKQDEIATYVYKTDMLGKLLNNRYLEDGKTYGNLGTHYVGYGCTYIYVEEETSYTGTICTDDKGTLYVNNNIIKKTTYPVDASITFTLNKGWNKIEVVYFQNEGYDGLEFKPRLNTIGRMNAGIVQENTINFNDQNCTIYAQWQEEDTTNITSIEEYTNSKSIEEEKIITKEDINKLENYKTNEVSYISTSKED